MEVRLIHRDAKPEERQWLEKRGTIARVVELRTMAYVVGAKEAKRDRLLVEMKAVDNRYPLYGRAHVDGKPLNNAALADLLKPRNGVPGALVEAIVLDRLKLKPGSRLKIGAREFEIRGALTTEPDRGTRLFTIGPRVMVSDAQLAATGLVRRGSLIYFRYRLKLPASESVEAVARAINRDLPKAGWRVRSLAQATPGARNWLERITLYLTLVGLTALLVGGLGIANGVRAWLDARTVTIATFKCLGAPARLVFLTYLIQVIVLAVIGIAAGLILGTLLPAALAGMVETILPVSLKLGIYPLPLALAALFGFLTALSFSLWAIARAREVPAGTLFRQAVAPVSARPKLVYMLATALLVALLAALAILAAVDKSLAIIFILACAVAFLIFRVLAWVATRLAARLSRPEGVGRNRPNLRFALANIHRPGAPTGSIILSLGLAATILVAIAMVQGNLSEQVRRQIPDQAPTFFFIDILPHQTAAFDKAVKATKGVNRMTRVPMVRARIVKIRGVPSSKARVAHDVRWALRNERGLTYAKKIPEGSEVIAGKWWSASYTGPPLISFDANLAAGMGLKVGDTITFNILGREITATIGNLRRIKWRTMGMNFTVIFAPGTLENAPHSHIAVVYTKRDAETPLLSAVTDALPNVSAIRVRDALAQAATILENFGMAVRVTALVTIFAGLLVLAGAVAAGHRRRVYDAIVLKVLGATRARILGAFLLEYGFLGVFTSLIAAAFGSIIGYLIIRFAMRGEWVFLPGTAFFTAFICLAVMLAFGFVGTWRAMSQKPAPLLRND